MILEAYIQGRSLSPALRAVSSTNNSVLLEILLHVCRRIPCKVFTIVKSSRDVGPGLWGQSFRCSEAYMSGAQGTPWLESYDTYHGAWNVISIGLISVVG